MKKSLPIRKKFIIQSHRVGIGLFFSSQKTSNKLTDRPREGRCPNSYLGDSIIYVMTGVHDIKNVDYSLKHKEDTFLLRTLV